LNIKRLGLELEYWLVRQLVAQL